MEAAQRKTRRQRPAVDRFTEKTAPGEGGCIEWTASLNSNGYGTFTAASYVTVMAHRWAYEHYVGPIPPGMTLDHLCRNRRCVNPEHLEPVTQHENLLRSGNAIKTHCPAGHPYSGSYLPVDPRTGHRSCHQCRRDRYYAKKKV